MTHCKNEYSVRIFRDVSKRNILGFGVYIVHLGTTHILYSGLVDVHFSMIRLLLKKKYLFPNMTFPLG